MMNNMINTLKRTIACAISVMMTMTFVCINNTHAESSENTSLYNEMVEQLNEYRESEGLSPLNLNETLCEMAEVRSQEISVSFSHTRPDGRSSSTIFDEFNFEKGYSGENIGYHYKKSTSDILEAWLDSEAHRANMFSSDYDSIGIGLYNDNGYYYWTQVFSSDVSNDDLFADLTDDFVTVNKNDSYTLGDVNNDASIDATDASLALSIYSQLSCGNATEYTDAQINAADVNYDGSVDACDASKILSYYASISMGLSAEF